MGGGFGGKGGGKLGTTGTAPFEEITFEGSVTGAAAIVAAGKVGITVA